MFREGSQIGPYTLIRTLGRGGFGEVWLAERRAKFVTTKVAVKLPLDEQIDHETIKQEATLWEQASGHPNILPIIDADEYDGQIVIVSEYAPDGSLDEWLKRNGKMPVEKAVETTVKILDGLQFLHSRQIIHRDLKPANILLQGETPRLADFGISRALRTTVSSQSSNVLGTFAYMSPEALDGKRSFQTDIWSIGVNLYQFLTRTLPFTQKEPSVLFTAIMMREFEPLPDSIPQDVKNIVAKALAKLPENRYVSTGEMLEDLRKVLFNVSFPQFAPTEILSKEILSKNIAAPATIENETATSETEQETVADAKHHLAVTKPSAPQDLAAMQMEEKESVITQLSAMKAENAGGTTENTAGVISKSKLPNGVEMNFAYIPAGSFEMGSTAGSDEKPVHTVKISQGFWMGQTVVTQEQWIVVMKILPAKWAYSKLEEDFLGDNKPIICFSWNDTQSFISKLNALKDGYKYRLPTEAEWEYAARSGTTGDYAGNLDAMAWYDGNADGHTHDVATKQANAWNLYDMHGNVWEWCQDWYGDYSSGTVTDPMGATSGSYRVSRGGSWGNGAVDLRSATRYSLPPSAHGSSLGFRVVRY